MNEATPLSSRATHQQWTATFSPTVTVKRRSGSRWFYTGMGLATILVVIVCFGRYFYGTVSDTTPLSLLVNLCAATFSAWLIFFLVQTALFAIGRTSSATWHHSRCAGHRDD